MLSGMRPEPDRPASPSLNEEWTAERFTRALYLPYGIAGRTPDELQRCPHCGGTYFRSNGGACPRCGGAVPLEPPRAVTIDYRIG